MGLVVIILLVHDHHGHPLVCCEYYPVVVLFELGEGPALCWIEVAVLEVLLLLVFK